MFSDPEDKDPDPRIEYSQEEETNKYDEPPNSEPLPNRRKSSSFLLYLGVGLLLILMVGVILDPLLKAAFNNAISQPNPNNSGYLAKRQEASENWGYSDAPTDGNYEFNAKYIRMPLAAYRTLEANQNVLYSPIIKPKTEIGVITPKTEIGGGDEIILLIIRHDGNSIAKNVTLEIKRVSLKDKYKEIELIDSVIVPDTIPRRMISSKLEPIKENLGNISNDKAVLVLISSSYPPKNYSVQQRVVRDVVNIPHRLIYEDSEGNEKRIKVRKILR
ncbi:MAG: hypothetical protein MGF17_13075 [Trichodesmium sp. MAG_R04]|nr:hypothetical protein [Trichodesmium sp. MAG_R04]